MHLGSPQFAAAGEGCDLRDLHAREDALGTREDAVEALRRAEAKYRSIFENAIESEG